MGQFRHAPVQRSVRAERHGHLRLLAQADKLFAGDKLSGNELFLGFLQPFLLPVFGLPPLFLFDAFFLLVLLPQTFPVPFAITDQGLGVKAELFVDSHKQELQVSFLLHGPLDDLMECCKELRSGFSYVLSDEESPAVDTVLEENVVQLQDDANLIVRFAVLIFAFEVGVYTLADFFQLA